MEGNAKFLTLLQRLKTASELGRMTWEKVGRRDSFLVKLSRGYFVQIERYLSEDIEHPEGFIARLYNSDGSPLETLHGAPETIEVLNDVFLLAHRSANKVDSLLDDLIRGVDAVIPGRRP